MPKKVKIFLVIAIPFWLILAVDIGVGRYKDSQNKYIVLKESEIHRADFVGTPRFKFVKQGELKKGRIVYRMRDGAKDAFLPKYYYIDTDYKNQGTLQGYVLKENLRKLEKE